MNDKSTKYSVFVAVLVIFLLLVTGTDALPSTVGHTSSATSEKHVSHAISNAPANQMCPVLPDEKVKLSVVIPFEGKQIAFCCAKCRAKFLANPSRYRASLATVLAQEAVSSGHRSDHAEDHDGSDGDGDHDHGDHAVTSGFMSHLLGWIGKQHPAVIHFPIALLMAAAVAEGLRWLTGRARFSQTARFCVVFGAMTAVLAVILGWLWGGFAWMDANWVKTTHRWVGTVTALWSVWLVWLALRDGAAPPVASRRTYLISLFIGAALAAAAGFFGGALVYGLDHLAW